MQGRVWAGIHLTMCVCLFFLIACLGCCIQQPIAAGTFRICKLIIAPQSQTYIVRRGDHRHISETTSAQPMMQGYKNAGIVSNTSKPCQ